MIFVFCGSLPLFVFYTLLSEMSLLFLHSWSFTLLHPECISTLSVKEPLTSCLLECIIVAEAISLSFLN